MIKEIAHNIFIKKKIVKVLMTHSYITVTALKAEASPTPIYI